MTPTPPSRRILLWCCPGGMPVYLAEWRGDPGRTYAPESARLYPTRGAAVRGLAQIVHRNPHRDLSGAVVEEVPCE